MGGLLAVLLEDQLEPGVGHNDDDNVDDYDDDHHLLLVRLSKLGNGLADLLSYISLCEGEKAGWSSAEKVAHRPTSLAPAWQSQV